MPRYSDDTLLKRALTCALLDRESLLDAYGGEGTTAVEIRTQIASLQAIQGKKLAKMTPAEYHAACLAFIYGEQWEQGLADSSPGKETEATCRKNVALFREVRLRRWGKTRLERDIETSIAVPLTELLKRQSDKSA
ncbi:hypothetical protein WJ97_13245 [Burkholderia ubonensis]|uniref:hypothetical protein n=1 Tax=Burkholderia ubonensis TaxID=101571 RepID=UPI00075E535F|nr:hypothetical protein [Burkholderia ubonensis]KVP96839.1 hypothetical protein WJ97_13245 [Burkholderia ubonensis]